MTAKVSFSNAQHQLLMKTAHALLLLFVCLFFLPTPSKAQSSFGIKTGMHLDYSIRQANSTPAISSWKRKDSQGVSPLLGVYANFELGRHFSLQTELMGLQKTWRSDLDFSPQEEEFKLTYLNVPFLLVMHEKRFGFEFGPAFNYLLINNNTSSDQVIEMESQQIELSVNAGLHYYFRKWTLGVRFTNDLTPFFSSQPVDIDRSTAEYYHRGYQFSIAYQL